MVSYLKSAREFLGTASELADKLGGNVKSNMISKKLKRYESELSEIGVEFTNSRSGDRREILLIYNPHDGNDSMTAESGS